jgi:hypothetical protein
MTSLREFDQIELERLRRMKECFEATQPDQSELVRAVQRWHRAKSQRVSAGRLRLAWVAACAMMLSGAAMAASNWRGLPNWITHAVTLRGAWSAKAPAKGSNGYVVERGGKRAQYDEPTELRLAPGETAAFVIDGARTELQGPATVRVQADDTTHGWITRFEPQGWAPAAPAPSASPVGSATIEPATAQLPQSALERNAPAKAPPQADRDEDLPIANANLDFDSRGLKGAWERAASAMRQGNERVAISALTEISQSADPSNRDAALLARAQLDMAAGRREPALAALRNLASTGATPFIRQRAGEILASGK